MNGTVVSYCTYCLTFRTLRMRYRAKDFVGFFEGVLLPLADNAAQLTMIGDGLLEKAGLFFG